MAEIRDIPVTEFLAALKKNGYVWVKSAMYMMDGSSCAFGQATRNLFPDLIPVKITPENDGDTIITNLGYALENAVSNLVVHVDANRLGIQIINKNDASTTRSYEEVVAFAENLLAPYIDKTLHVQINEDDEDGS